MFYSCLQLEERKLRDSRSVLEKARLERARTQEQKHTELENLKVDLGSAANLVLGVDLGSAANLVLGVDLGSAANLVLGMPCHGTRLSGTVCHSIILIYCRHPSLGLTRTCAHTSHHAHAHARLAEHNEFTHL
jgi:hypothetical protein